MNRIIGPRRMVSPGLPASPPLFFDERDGTATVNVCVATWRGWGLAQGATKFVTFGVSGLAGSVIWHGLSELAERGSQVCLTAMGFGLTYGMGYSLTHSVLDGFFARQFFSTRTQLRFTSESFSFRSRFYRKPVVIWRKWRGQPVELRFDVTKDCDASDFGYSPYQNSNLVQRRRQTACVIRLIVAVASSHRPVQSFSDPLMRAIPLLEVDDRDAPRVATVLTAAAAITSRHTQASSHPQAGVDVDLVRQ